MKTISFRDLLVAEELSHIRNEIELLSIKNDDLMKDILAQIGFDVDYPVVYIASKHRDMQGRVAVGFQAVGDVSLNRKLLNSPVCDATDRLVAASYQDPGFARELAQMMNIQVNYSNQDFDEDPEYDEELEEDYEAVKAQIKQLEDLRDQIRGSMFNSAGDYKTYAEYKGKQ